MKAKMKKLTIHCDSSENTVRATVNSYGKKIKFNNGGYRVGLFVLEDKTEAVFYNTQCPDQFAGECFAVLKAVEFATEAGCSEAVIVNDRIGSFVDSTKRGYVGAKYLWVAQKIASENGLEVSFDRCSSAENLADSVARREGCEQGIQPTAEEIAAKRKIAASFAALAEPSRPVETTTPAVDTSRSARGPEFQAWFDAHKTEWPEMRDTWKAQGLSSRERDEKLAETVAEWAKSQPEYAH